MKRGSSPIKEKLEAMPHLRPTLTGPGDGGARRPAGGKRTGKMTVAKHSYAKGIKRLPVPQASSLRLAMTAQAGSGVVSGDTAMLHDQNAALDTMIEQGLDVLSQVESPTGGGMR
jgi:hypothetical protein